MATRLIGFVSLSLIQAVLALLLRAHGENVMRSGGLMRAGGTFDNPNYLVTLCIVALPLCVTIGLLARNNAQYIAAAITLAAVAAALVCTWSRGGVIAATVGCFVVIRHFALKSGNSLVPLVMLLIAFSIVPFAARSSGVLNAASTDRSNAGRVYLVKEAIHKWNQSPLLGSGIDTTQIDIVWPSSLASGRPARESVTDPRSTALLWLIELGIGGFCLYIMFVVSAMKQLWMTNDALKIAFLGAIIGLLLSGVFDVTFGSVYHNPGNASLGFLIASLCLEKEGTLLLADEEEPFNALVATAI